MRKPSFPTPVAGGQQVQPGPFEPGEVPDPREAVCIEVVKIYDACSQKECPSVEFNDLKKRPAEIISCSTSDFEFDCTMSQTQEDPPLVRASLTYSYKVTVVYEDEDGDEVTVCETVSNDKSVVLFGTDEMFCKVEAVLECLGCDIFANNISSSSQGSKGRIICEIGEYIVIKSALEVQLLIPSYGFCPAPPECEELPTRCGEFFEGPAPPLFPPQPWDVDNGNDENNNENDDTC